MNDHTRQIHDLDPDETRDWLDSLDAVVEERGADRAHYLLTRLLQHMHVEKMPLPALIQTPYVNTIPPSKEPGYPGDEHIEKRIRRYIRWNAVAMVVRANKKYGGIGGHLSSYASAATLYEVGFNHFFRGHEGGAGDQVFMQGHASPGVYARAFLEGRISEEQMLRFRREVGGGGLSSYPHPRLMKDFWEFPTVSMGLGPIAAIYQARFNRYLEARGIADTAGSRVWAFLGDGETDEPEALGALHLASRERLDNLVFVVNCNLQRLDGPVRGNGKIIQELEAVFHGSGWRVIKCIWGREWDALLAADRDGVLLRRMAETVDGTWQKLATESGAYIREQFFGADPRLKELVAHLTDEDIRHLRRGGHDLRKVYAAYKEACTPCGRPTVVLAKTVKGWTLGEGAEARNTTHQQKKLEIEELRAFRDKLHLDIPDDVLHDPPFMRFSEGSLEHKYLIDRRRALGGFLPARRTRARAVPAPTLTAFDRYLGGSGEQDVSTTGAFSRMLADLLRSKELGRRIVPIIPDEARTFGLDALFRTYGIYSSKGQLYEPVDAAMLLSYREATDGQVLEEGITEAGATASFAAAATSYATFGEPMVPFYIFYSMFGFQRTGDQVWAAGDQMARGFMLGATAGRTTLNGEGLQHQDGHSHILASTHPHVRPYDPAFAYEIAVLVQNGLEEMLEKDQSHIYYITLQNEAYTMPPMPEGARDGIIRGMYLLEASSAGDERPRAQLLGSGSILQQVRAARDLLEGRYGVAADVWSVTSYPMLRRDALAAERWSMLHPDQEPREPYITRTLKGSRGPVVAATDFVKALPDMVARWVGREMLCLGTDGFGRSDTRDTLRAHFEVSPAHIVVAALTLLADRGEVDRAVVGRAITELGVATDGPDPIEA